MPTANCQIDFMKSLHSFLIAIAAVLVLGSCGDSEPSKANKPVRVKVMQIGSVQVNGEHAYSGTVEEESGVSLSFSVAGTLRSVSVEEGQIVNAGQLVATVDGIDQAGRRLAPMPLPVRLVPLFRRLRTTTTVPSACMTRE